MKRIKSLQKVTCIIPAINEEKTIGKVIDTIKQVDAINEIIVVDDGSQDKTARIAKKKGVRLIRHEVNSGKGSAMKDGARAAKNNFLVFIDADLQNLSSSKVQKLIDPLIKGEADFVKASYRYAMARVAKLVVKPLLKIVYPFMKLEHPLSGEVAFSRKKFKLENIEDGWGVDIQLVLQAAHRNLRIKEVFLGKKEHKHQDLDALSEMSEQIIRTILSDLQLIAHKHKLVFFDLDKTLIGGSSIEFFAKEWGFQQELHALQKDWQQKKIPDRKITKTLAKHFAGKTQKEVDSVCQKIPISPFAEEVIGQLRRQRYRVRIISSAFSPVVQYFATKLGIHDFVCPRLRKGAGGRFSGTLRSSSTEDVNDVCCGMYICKKKAVDMVRKKFGWKRSECMAIGDGKNDCCMFEACGLSLGYKTDIGNVQIENLSEVLVYAK